MKKVCLILGLMTTVSSYVNAFDKYEGIIDAETIFVTPYEYANDKALHSIVIPAPVEQIGTSAFKNSGLNTVTFEPFSALNRIHENAFAECEYLNHIIIPASIRSIGNNAFIDSGLNELVIESNNCNDSCTIASMAFAGTPITSISILKNISKIGKEAFKSCQFESLTINGLDFVGNASFALNKNLTNVAFMHCSNIIINQDAFFECKNLNNFTISGTIKSIHPNAFGYFNHGQYAPITNFTIFGAEDARIRNQLIVAGIRPEAIHFE